VHDAENKPRGFGSRATTATTDAEGGEWSRESRPARDQAAFSRNGGGGGGGAGTGHGTGGAGGGGGGWKRGEAIQSDSLALRDDGVKRYDKATLLGLYKTKKVCPDTIKEQYLHLAQIERQPLLLKTIKQLPPPKSKSSGHVNEEPHPDEQIIFAQNKEGKEGVFRYQPSRLSDTTDPAVILSKANLILNKLSMTKFDKLSDEFMAVGLDSEDLMDKAVEMIVQKAQLEEHFCFMYADLCRKITDQWSSGSAENEESLGKSFRVKLLEYCRAEFSRNRVAELEAIRNMEISPEEKDEREIVLKKRYTGTMRFIGEVYMKNLVTSGIMQTCITELLQATEEETLVCMCKLFRTIGHKLQQNDSKKKTDKVSEFFETISKMAVEHPSSRMRFMLKDLVDLRKAGWVERRETEKAVKLSELRGDEAPSGGKGHTASSRASSSSNISSFGSKSQDARASRVEPAADEWSVVPEKSKAKVRAPGSSGGFGQSSSTSSSAKSSNAFSALGKSSGSVKLKDAVKASGSSKAAPSVTKKSNAVERVAAVGGLRTESPALSDAPDEEGVGMEHSVSFGVSENGESPRSVTGQAGAGGAIVDKAVVEQVKRFVTGYFSELEKDDVTESIQSVVHPDGMGDIIRPCILLAFDKREADRENLVNLFVHLHSEGVLRTEQMARGLSAFLDDLDETAIDVPMAVSYPFIFIFVGPATHSLFLPHFFPHTGNVRSQHAGRSGRAGRHQSLVSHAAPRRAQLSHVPEGRCLHWTDHLLHLQAHVS
jgi:translation initiation factor 4G